MTVIFAAIGFALGIARLVMFVALHVVPSDYNIVEHAVSDYAVGRTRRLSTAMTWTTAAMWAALALAVGSGFSDWDDRVGIIICLSVLAVVFVALPFLPTDLEGETASTIGRLHLLAAIAWFALSYACMGNFVRLLSGGVFAGVLDALSWISLVALIALVVALVIPSLRRRAFGVAERVFIIAVTVFYTLVGLQITIL